MIDGKYEQCYESCAECDDKGTPENHNCKICKAGYSKLNNGKDNNCYPDCNNYYYFNESNHYICLPEKKCPDGYKLIAEKKKCIKNCKDDNIFNYIYEYDGTCVQSCSAGDYTIDGQKVCKCMKNTACQDCPSSGNPNNLCKTCNEGYYPKSEENDKNLKQCYNNENKPSNYIFDSNLYKRCYESCGTCTEIGDSSNHKCGDCASGYKRHDNEHNDNCYPICDYYFYFDDNHGVICTENQACPPNYKLVYSTTKCVKNCMDDGLYEYNNVCYQSCPYGHYSNEEGINTCTCMSNAACKVCNEDGSCSSCNNINGYYHKKEESENSIKNCYNTAPQKYFLNESTSQYEPCYSSCKTCESSGTPTNHNCADCIDNYLKINLDNNCYQNCGENYYYFNNNNEYACSDKVGCPGDYKWIESTKKCISKCKDDDMYNKKFEYKNVCYENCPNEYYTKDGINICKCKTNIACKDCDEHGSCYSCNNDKGYYHKKEESESEIKTCYNNASIGKNYIFNSSALRYDPCYESCEECDIIGTEDNHQCKKCKEGYSNLKNNNNCYQDCVHYYYFDEHNKYFCLDVDACPINYKLINSEKECIRNCKDINRYEYNNICYEECPLHWTSDSNNICKLDCAGSGLFFNYEKTECINEIPEGYYLKDSVNKYIDKCHENCQTCEIGPTENNNNCIKCKSTGSIYYDFGNCRVNCVNGYYTDENSIKKCKCTNNIACKACNENGKCFSCNNEVGYYKLEDDDNEDSESGGIIKCDKQPEGYYLLGDIYKKCDPKCKSCTGAGDNKCIECNSQYEFKNDFDNDKRCYQKCPHNYYYDISKNIICTEDDSCPNNMKIIEPKKRCIDLCKNDNKYKFEFNGKCFEQCPENTEVSIGDSNKCEEIKEETTIVTTEAIETTQIIEEKTDECNLELNEVDLFNDTLTVDELNNLTTNYASKHGNSGNYVTKIENEYFKIFIYNNIICLKNVSPDAKWIDFGDSLYSLAGENQISNPIVSIVTDKTTNTSTYTLSDPTTGEISEDLNQNLKGHNVRVLEDIYFWKGDNLKKFV